jgi:hypothetical protein
VYVEMAKLGSIVVAFLCCWVLLSLVAPQSSAIDVTEEGPMFHLGIQDCIAQVRQLYSLWLVGDSVKMPTAPCVVSQYVLRTNIPLEI